MIPNWLIAAVSALLLAALLRVFLIAAWQFLS